MKEIFQGILDAMDAGIDTILVSVIETSGSTPRKAGAHMLVAGRSKGSTKLLCGTVGGGPLEGRALQLCVNFLESHTGGLDRVLLRGNTAVTLMRSDEQGMPAISSSQGVSIGAICGGEVTLRFQFIASSDARVRSAAELALSLLAEHKQCWLMLDHAGTELDVTEDLAGEKSGRDHDRNVVMSGAFSETSIAEHDVWFAQALLGDSRVYIFGGGHVAQALVPVLSGVGFRCVVIDDRPEFCQPELFANKAEEIFTLPLDGWDQELHVTSRDYICIMTRGHKNDLDSLIMALRSPACYIGLMGSRRKIAVTNDALRRRGFSEQDIARISTPIGLEINAETPAEIAVSIAAEMIKVRAERRTSAAESKNEDYNSQITHRRNAI